MNKLTVTAVGNLAKNPELAVKATRPIHDFAWSETTMRAKMSRATAARP
jgi:hypothetical protein